MFGPKLLSLAATIALLGFSGPVRADEKADEAAKQKAAAADTLKKAGLEKIAAVETDDLLLFTTLPEARAKTLADNLEKVHDTARKELKVPEADKLWPGKLTVVALTDTRQFGVYMRAAETVRPAKGSTTAINVRSSNTTPYAVVCVEPANKASDAELTAGATELVAAAVLHRNAGTSMATGNVPDWAVVGFARVVAARTDASGQKLAAARTKMKSLVVGTKTKPSPVRLANIWDGSLVKVKDADVVYASLVDYMLYGLEAGKFAKFVGGFKPDENDNSADIAGVLRALEWTPESLETSWKQHVAKLK